MGDSSRDFNLKQTCMNRLGFSLLEMLLALLLSAILMRVVGLSFLNCMHATEQDRALIELQDNARIAQKILSSAIMQAGFMGCDNTKQRAGFYIDHQHLFIHKVSSNLIPVFSVLEANHLLLSSDARSFQAGDHLMLSNCHDVFYTKVKRVEIIGSLQHVYLEKELPTHLRQSCFITQVEDVEFYLSKSRVSNELSLYEKNPRGQKQDLLPGVASWSFECFSQHEWKKPESISDWNTVSALNVKLLMKSKEFIFFMPILNHE